jgi:addiction module RelE/StbE family toxin
MFEVKISKTADKNLKKAPPEVRNAFDAWKNVIKFHGIKGVLQINGYRDHKLSGDWEGARSSSLNYQWRVIYYVSDKEVKVFVLEVTPHDYRRKL